MLQSFLQLVLDKEKAALMASHCEPEGISCPFAELAQACQCLWASWFTGFAVQRQRKGQSAELQTQTVSNSLHLEREQGI